jgi:hypothetical protein
VGTGDHPTVHSRPFLATILTTKYVCYFRESKLCAKLITFKAMGLNLNSNIIMSCKTHKLTDISRKWVIYCMSPGATLVLQNGGSVKQTGKISIIAIHNGQS